jgi:hypothetical protein
LHGRNRTLEYFAILATDLAFMEPDTALALTKQTREVKRILMGLLKKVAAGTSDPEHWN